MPDTSLPEVFLSASEMLVQSIGDPPDQGLLRRALSSCYYAVFHAFARTFANDLAGPPENGAKNYAWIEIYRALDHSACKDACKRASTVNFPDEIKNAADGFHQLQIARLRADYDPKFRATLSEVKEYLTLARECISAIAAPDEKDRVAFASFVLMARKRSR